MTSKTSNNNSISNMDEKENIEKTIDNKVSRWNYIYAICAAINSCNLGYDIGVSTDLGLLITHQFGLTMFERQVYTSFIDFWAIFGAFFSCQISDRFGRKANFTSTAILMILGIILQAVATNFWILIVGRAFVGFGCGIGFAVDPIYIAEISDKKHRGFLVSFSEIATNIGIVFGFSSSLVFASLNESIRWRVMVSMGVVLPIIMLLLVKFVLPESPRWLIANGKEEEAREVLKKVYVKDSKAIDPIIQDMKLAVEFDEVNKKEGSGSWSSLLFRSTPAVRRMLIVGVGCGISQQAVGINAIQYYLNTVIAAVGIPEGTTLNAILLTLMIVKLISTTAGGYLVDRNGRRPMAFISLTGCIVGLIFVSASFFLNSKTPNPAAVISGIVLYLVFFSLAMGPLNWLLPSEVFTSSIRAKGMSLTTCADRFISFLFEISFLSTATAMGWGPFYLMLAIVCCIVMAFYYLLVPETKGKSLEEMNLFFAEITNDTTTIETEKKLKQRVLQNRTLVDDM